MPTEFGGWWCLGCRRLVEVDPAVDQCMRCGAAGCLDPEELARIRDHVVSEINRLAKWATTRPTTRELVLAGLASVRDSNTFGPLAQFIQHTPYGAVVRAVMNERSIERMQALLARAVPLIMEVEGPGGTADPVVVQLLADIAALDREPEVPDADR
jgi:hypothetical protein